MRFRSYKKNKVGTYLSRSIIFIVLAVIMAIGIIGLFSKRANEVIIPMAEAKLRKIVATLINESTKDIIFDKRIKPIG